MEKLTTSFLKKRTLNDIIQDTFFFLKQDYRQLLKTLLYIAGPFMLIASILNATIQPELQEMLRNPENLEKFSPKSLFFRHDVIISMLLGLLSHAFFLCGTYGYIILYMQKGKNNFGISDVYARVRTDVLPIFSTLVLVLILVVFGFFLFIIPGVWVAVSLAAVFIIRMNEKLGFNEAFHKSFSLVRREWWKMLFIYVVSFAVVYFGSILVSLPQLIANQTFGLDAPVEELSGFQKNMSFFLNTVTYFVSGFLNAIPLIMIAFEYFNLLLETNDPVIEQDQQNQ